MPGGESMRTSGIGTWLAGAACFALGSFAGAWGGALLAESPRAAALEAEGGAAAGADELARTVAELRAAVAELAAAAGRLATTDRPSAARVPAPAANGSDELAEALRQLSAAVESLRDRSAAATRPSLPEPTPVDRATAFDLRTLREAWLGRDDDARERELDAVRARHMLWSSREALRTYGKPDRIWLNDGLETWSYRLPLADGGREELLLQFHDGMLINVEYDLDAR